MGLFGSGPAPPTLTAKNLPDQSGKVFIITGATGGIGIQLTQILYAHNAKVYVAARSPEKAATAIKAINAKYPNSTGKLVYLRIDFDDLSTIKTSANEFLTKEKHLHVLWNNAGVMIPPQGSFTKQNYELQLGTNCIAPFLFTKLLTPTLIETAKVAPAGSVRVVWVSSSAADLWAPDGGVNISNLDYKSDKSAWHKYAVSKSLDPGNLKTDLYNNLPRWQAPLVNLRLKDPIFGAYTELYGGLSPDITPKQNGAFLSPWGKVAEARKDIENSRRSKADGGSGVAAQFWDWNEAQIAKYLRVWA